MLKIKNLSHTYITNNGGVEALKNINLEIPQGELISIVGHSGCGKSSLLNLIAGLNLPLEGEIVLDDKIINAPTNDIAIILQNYGLFPWKTVYQNLALGLVIQKVSKKKIKIEVEKIARELGLFDKLNKYPAELSGGQQQRVAIGRALVLKPKFLLMDEPFSALDIMTQEHLENLVLTLCMENNISLIIVTHNIEEAVYLGDRVVVFASENGVIHSIIDNPKDTHNDFRSTENFYKKCSEVRKLITGDYSEE